VKYLKKYENNRSAYNLKVGDYVLVKQYYTNKPDKNIFGKIINISPDYTAHFPYKILTSDNNTDTYNFSNIIRYLTDDEINIFDAQIAGNKYNI
jgi:hypothetical protein